MKLARRLVPRFRGLAVVVGLLVLPCVALADSVDPSSVTATVDQGETLSIQKTVTVSAVDAQVDVFFLFDTTATMDLASATAGANDIITGISGLGDLAYGVGSYQDFPVVPYGNPPGDPDAPADSPFTLVQDFSSNAGSTTTAIDGLTLGYGLDAPESQLYALDQVSTTASWREDAVHVVVWFGDAPGHDGVLEPGYPSDVGLGDVIVSLGTESIVVQAFDMGALDATGQATAITGATGGDLLLGVDTSNVDQVIAAINDAIDQLLSYTTVELEVVGDTDNTDIVVTPLQYAGDFDRTVDRTFDFQVDVTGTSIGSDSFDVYALVDGQRVAVETDFVEVVPEPKAAMLFGIGSLLVAGSLRRRALA